MGITMQVIGFVLSLGFLVLTHELGHFFFAKLFKTRIDKFYLFFNPWFSILRVKKYDGKYHFSLFSTKSPEAWASHPDKTEWGIGWLPLGGYCAINGMVDETQKASDLSAEIQPYEFRAKPAWQRLLIVLGGVLVNFVSAILIYAFLLFKFGESYIPMENAHYGLQFTEIAQNIGFKNGDKIISMQGKPVPTAHDFSYSLLLDTPDTVIVLRDKDTIVVRVPQDFAQQVLRDKTKAGICSYNFPFVIDSVLPNSPANKADLRRGDSLIGVEHTPVFSSFDYQRIFTSRKNQEILLNVSRLDSSILIPVVPDTQGHIGVSYKDVTHFLPVHTITYNLLESFPRGIALGWEKLSSYVKQFKLFKTKEGVSQMGGFITIGSIFSKTWNWEHWWNITAFLAIILAFMNFLPIPALDGGYILFILFEIITRKKPSDKFLGYANTVGFTLLLLLILYANGMDILRLFFK
ncbi:MAG: RIP metalloprotease RseP [Bacteroidales bacterium]|jgi:regulator of sigma E protease|nr:RIP metalloprotease RseP [Bacteroidales bacterium]